jgi:hypothetical protein
MLSALHVISPIEFSTLDLKFDPLWASLWTQAIYLSSQAFWLQVLYHEAWESGQI